jgi:hypothetical protein
MTRSILCAKRNRVSGVDSLNAVSRSGAPDVHQPRGAQLQAGSALVRPTAPVEEARRGRRLAKGRTLGPDEAPVGRGPLGVGGWTR